VKVKFKRNNEPCIVYETNGVIVTEYDELLKKYCPCYFIDILGWCDATRFEEAKEHPENINSIDVAVFLTNS
jgi:hypothetical protein